MTENPVRIVLVPSANWVLRVIGSNLYVHSHCISYGKDPYITSENIGIVEKSNEIRLVAIYERKAL